MRVFAVLGDVVSDAEDGAVVLADEGFEGRGVSGTGALYEGYVRVNLFCAGLFKDGHGSWPVYVGR